MSLRTISSEASRKVDPTSIDAIGELMISRLACCCRAPGDRHGGRDSRARVGERDRAVRADGPDCRNEGVSSFDRPIIDCRDDVAGLQAGGGGAAARRDVTQGGADGQWAALAGGGVGDGRTEDGADASQRP
jgi:hypothetical protein